MLLIEHSNMQKLTAKSRPAGYIATQFVKDYLLRLALCVRMQLINEMYDDNRDQWFEKIIPRLLLRVSYNIHTYIHTYLNRSLTTCLLRFDRNNAVISRASVTHRNRQINLSLLIECYLTDVSIGSIISGRITNQEWTIVIKV